MQINSFTLDKEQVIFKDLGIIHYKQAWEQQEELVKYNMIVKSKDRELNRITAEYNQGSTHSHPLLTKHYLLFCEHPPVYTLGKSGNFSNVLMSEKEMEKNDIEFFKTNRGGDITFHGLQQVVGYPILDLEKFYTDIGRYLRDLEEVIIRTLSEYNIVGERSKGETGVWIEPGIPGKARKICAMGIRCSRWVTMHGFALNVNTDLSYFNNIIPCGIVNKKVTSLELELNKMIDIEIVKSKLKHHFAEVFDIQII